MPGQGTTIAQVTALSNFQSRGQSSAGFIPETEPEMSLLFKKIFSIQLVAMFCLLVFSLPATAQTTVSFSWSPNPAEENVAGYTFYFGQSSRDEATFAAYDEEVDVGNVAEFTIVVPDDNADYFFTMAAYDKYGVKGPLSRELRLSDYEFLSVSASAGLGGVVSPGGITEVAFGDAASFSIIPDQGYEIADVLVDGVSVGPVSEYVFDRVTDSHAIEAQFSAIFYSVQTSASVGGTISPYGQTEVFAGEALTVNTFADDGFFLADLIVDGISIGQASSYTFANISEDHIVEAVFEQAAPPTANEFTITASLEGQGAITNLNDLKSLSSSSTYLEVTVKEGGDVQFWLKSADGWELADVVVDGESKGPLAQYNFTAVNSDHSIHAVFSRIMKEISVAAVSGEGTVDPSGLVLVPQGADQTFQIQPADGYEIGKITLDGLAVETTTQYTLTNVLEPHAIDVFFYPIKKNLLDSDGDGIPDETEIAIGTDPFTADIDRALLPVRSQPVNGGTVTSPNPVLSVYNPIVSVQFTFEFRVFDQTMKNVLASESGIEPGVGITYWTVPVALENGQKYVWQARTIGERSSSPWTRPSKFKVEYDGLATVATVQYSQYLVGGELNIVDIPEGEGSVSRVSARFGADSLSYDEIFTVAIVSNPPIGNSDAIIVGNVYDLGPSGIDFAESVTLSLPYNERDLALAGIPDIADLTPVYYNADSEIWESLPIEAVDEENSRITFQTPHFSMFALGVANASGENGSTGSGGGGGGCFIAEASEAQSKPSAVLLGLAIFAAIFSGAAFCIKKEDKKVR